MFTNRIHDLDVLSPSEYRHESICQSILSSFSTRQPRPSGHPTAASASVLVFARDMYYWSPARVLRTVWGILRTLPRQIEILRVMRLPAYAEYVRTDPRFRFKFLIRDYLVRGFSITERSACFLHHYKRLLASMSASLLHRVLYQNVTVFETRNDGMDLRISLCFSRPFEKEGELSLNFHVDGTVVFVLSFTIVPGWAVGAEAGEALLISRLQGTSGYYRQIRAATKALHDVGPAALLLAALHGFGNAFGIDSMAGVSAARQSSYKEELSRFYVSAYDDFFAELGVQRSSSGFFLGALPPEDRPMSSIKQGHKIRTREKRQFKRDLADNVSRLLAREMKVRAPEFFREEELIAAREAVGD
jgi:uncharacterized protein VirK/YbjX